MLCAFPLTGGTDVRNGPHACGQYRDDQTGTSNYCHVQGITTYDKWIQHYMDVTANSDDNLYVKQCGFDMTISTAARDFGVVIEANTYLRENSEKYAYMIDELRVFGWDEDKPELIPIQAFFYLKSIQGAFEKAAIYQDDFYKYSGGETVPIVSIELPTNTNRNIEVEYHPRVPHIED